MADAPKSITEWLEQCKEDPKLYAMPVVLVIAVYFVGYKILYAPNLKPLKKQLRKNKGVERSIKSVKSAANDIEDIKLRLEELRANAEKTKKLFYKPNEATKFMRRIRSLGKMAGVQIKTVNPKPIKPIKLGEISAKQFSVTFDFKGELAKLGTLLRLIEKEEKITFVELPPLIPDASNTFQIELSPSTIMLDESGEN